MSSHKLLLNSNEETEVMVRQVNLAAAFHDHISCTKISQQSIQTNICVKQESETSQTQTQTSLPYETDHIYATDGKHNINNNSNESNCNIHSNGIVGNKTLFDNNSSDERNQIQKLTEMILAQLDLIQHQQEQLLKKDRQLQGLKQDREALCLRLEKMEKRIHVLTTKVANVNNTNNTNIITNNNNNNLNLNRNIANSSNNSNNTTETDCDQSGSDTIIEDNNSTIGLFNDPIVFAKLYSQSSSVAVSNFNLNNSNNNNNNIILNSYINESKTNTNIGNSITTARIKSEPQTIDTIDCGESTTTTTSSVSVRKNRKRHPEIISSTSASTIPSNKKRCKSLSGINTSDLNSIAMKKESLGFKETSSESLNISQNNRTYSNSNKKKANKLFKSETSRLDSSSASTSLNWKTSSLNRDILTTTKPYSITVNSNNHLPLELCLVNNSNENKTNIIENSANVTNCKLIENKRTCVENSDTIEVPFWRLHPVSSCYSLEGTENLDDEVFNRRHSKLEIDERRRKRWDIQRLREQRHNEKLRTGRYYSGSLGNCFIEKPSDLKPRKTSEITSFFPDLKNVHSIEVTEKIPVIAFGHSIPRLPTKSFSLPWNIIAEKPQTTPKTRNSPLKKH